MSGCRRAHCSAVFRKSAFDMPRGRSPRAISCLAWARLSFKQFERSVITLAYRRCHQTQELFGRLLKCEVLEPALDFRPFGAHSGLQFRHVLLERLVQDCNDEEARRVKSGRSFGELLKNIDVATLRVTRSELQELAQVVNDKNDTPRPPCLAQILNDAHEGFDHFGGGHLLLSPGAKRVPKSFQFSERIRRFAARGIESPQVAATGPEQRAE